MSLLQRMAAALQLPESLILGIANKADHSYFEYTIPKRGGGERKIAHPSRELKTIQRWLLFDILEAWPVHPAAFAYRKGLGIRAHAEAHVDSRFLVRMDLQDFFPSIHWDDIRLHLEGRPPATEDWTDTDRVLFGKIVCRRGRLTIGAPSSPALSNAICYQLDAELSALAVEIGATYTRYADDFFFSTTYRDRLWTCPDRVRDVLARLDCPARLALNEGKTRHSSRKGRRQVTGLVLASDGNVRLGRSRKRFIRKQVHELENLDAPSRASLAGLIAFAADIEPDFINALILKYGPERVAAARGSDS